MTGNDSSSTAGAGFFSEVPALAGELTPAEAQALSGRPGMPYPTSKLLIEMGLEVSLTPDLRRRAITYPFRNLVRVRADHPAVMRVALAHELGHLGHGHSADRPHWCVVRPGESPIPEEREADAWSLDYLMPAQEIARWIQIGKGLALSELAAKAFVPLADARRQVKRLGCYEHTWDDERDKAAARRHPFFRGVPAGERGTASDLEQSSAAI